jgi:hypothetical protein
MQQPKKRPDTPLASTPDPKLDSLKGSALKIFQEKRAAKKAENALKNAKDSLKSKTLKEAGDRIKSDASKYI